MATPGWRCQELHPGLLRGWQGPRCLCHLPPFPAPGSQVRSGQPGVRSAPFGTRDAGAHVVSSCGEKQDAVCVGEGRDAEEAAALWSTPAVTTERLISVAAASAPLPHAAAVTDGLGPLPCLPLPSASLPDTAKKEFPFPGPRGLSGQLGIVGTPSLA